MKTDKDQKLFMMLLGCKPKDRFTEQHDIFFAIGESLKSLVPEIKKFWHQGKHNLHIDAWRQISFVDGYKISLRKGFKAEGNELNLFFINLGGYEENIFDEKHYKLIIVAQTPAEAIKKAKSVEFFKTYGFKGATSHIDDKFDVDDIINMKDVLNNKEYYLHIEKSDDVTLLDDTVHLGYFKLSALTD